MAFSTWAALRTSLLNAMEDYISNGSVITKSYTTPTGATHNIRDLDEMKEFIKFVDTMISLESAGSRSTRVSYGRHRGFKT